MAASTSGKKHDSSSGGVDCSIRVVVRVRPPVKESAPTDTVCVNVDNEHHAIILQAKPDPKVFTFDQVADTYTTQEHVFSSVGKSIIDSCMEGYHGTVFAYGQTGSGKTFTMLGPSENADNFQHVMRGVIPRSFEYLFNIISRKKELVGDKIQFLCRCSFLEIYNEQIFDLLDPVQTNLQLREDIKKGVFVDGLQEQTVDSASQAYEVLTNGWLNRTVAETSMNRESSRSHAVFTVFIESKEFQNSVWKIRTSQLNLVDLAGSERQKDTNTAGKRLKEASNINKSLSTLGNVIMALVDVGNGKSRHVPYRDSKLSFLLRDSLGGSAKTCMIACVHPGSKCFGETLSTLQFAARAKMIKNKVKVNENAQGNMEALQAEVQRLKNMLIAFQHGEAVPNQQSELSLLPDTTKEDQDLPPEKLWQKNFIHAMYFREICYKEKKNLEEQYATLKEALQQKQNQLSNTQRVLTFRSNFLQKIEKKMLTDSDKDTEIKNLLEQLRISEQINISHPDMTQLKGKIAFLSNELKNLKAEAAAGVEGLSRNRVRLQELQKTFYELREKNNPEDLEKQLSKSESALQAQQHTPAKASKSVSKQIAEKDEKIDQLEKELLQLKAQLTASQKSKDELEKVLNTHRIVSRIERESIDQMHMETIKTMTTPKKEQYQLRNRTVLVPLKSLSPDTGDENFDIEDIAPPREYVDGLCEEIKTLKDEVRKLREKLEEKDSELVRSAEQQSLLQTQKEQLDSLLQEVKQNSITAQEDLTARLVMLQDEMAQIQSEFHYKKSEAEDLTIMWKAESTTVGNMKEKNAKLQARNDELETKLVQLETDNSNLQKDIENMKSEIDSLQDENETFQETVMFTQSQLSEVQEQYAQSKTSNSQLELKLEDAQQQLKAEQERRMQLASQSGDREKELLESYQSLQKDMEKKKEVATRLEKVISDMEADKSASLEKIANLEKDVSLQKESLDNTLQLLTKERQAHKVTFGELDSTKLELEEMTQQRALLNEKLEQLEESFSQLERESTTKETQLKDTIDRLICRLQQSEAQIQMQADDFTDLHTTINQYEATTEEHRNNISQLEKEVSDLKNINSNLKDTISTLQEEIAKKEKLYEEKLLESQDQAMQEITAQLNEARGEIMKYRVEAEDLKITLKQTLNDLEEAREQLQVSQLEQTTLMDSRDSINRDLDSAQTTVLRLQEDLKDTNDRLQELARNNEVTKSYCEKLAAERNEALNKYTSLTSEVTSKMEKISRLEEDLQSKTDFMERYEQRALQDAAMVEELRSKIANLEEQLHRTKTEKEELESTRQTLMGQLASLAGHANHNQKIHYVEKLKDELDKAQKALASLESDRLKLRQRCEKMEKKLAVNKISLTPMKKSVMSEIKDKENVRLQPDDLTIAEQECENGKV